MRGGVEYVAMTNVTDNGISTSPWPHRSAPLACSVHADRSSPTFGWIFCGWQQSCSESRKPLLGDDVTPKSERFNQRTELQKLSLRTRSIHALQRTLDECSCHQLLAKVRFRPRLCKNANLTSASRHSTFQNARYGVFARSGMVTGPLKTRSLRVFPQPGP